MTKELQNSSTMVDLKHIPSLPAEDQTVHEVQQVQQVQNSSTMVDLKHIPSLPTEDQAVHFRFSLKILLLSLS